MGMRINNANWRDQLTEFNHEPIEYDAIGNPQRYDSWTYDWRAGRQLAAMYRDDLFLDLGDVTIIHGDPIPGTQVFLADGQTGTVTFDGKVQIVRYPGRPSYITYTYNAAGLRVQKEADSVWTDYFLHGKNIMHLTRTGGGYNDSLHFYYDAQSRPQTVKFNGAYYDYVVTVQQGKPF